MKIAKLFVCSAITISVLSPLLAGQAQASTIGITDTGGANFGSGSVGYGGTGWITPNPNSNTASVDIYIGGDSFTTTNKTYAFSSTGQFNVWCVDIYHWMSTSATYAVDTGSDLASTLSTLRPGSPSGTTRVNELVELADEVYGSVNTAATSAAFQLAVWEITYGTPNGSGIYQISTTDPAFNVDSATASSAYGLLADKWLDNLGTVPNTGTYALTYLSDGTQGTTQNVVVFSSAPEPASLALLGLGMLGIVFARRKRA